MKNERVDEFLKHYGVLGMKWGVRKGSSSSSRRKKSSSSKSSDAKKTDELAKRGAKNLSDKQLKAVNNRLNMEKQFNSLTAKQKSKGRKFVEDVLGQASKEALKNYASKEMTKALESTLTKKTG